MSFAYLKSRIRWKRFWIKSTNGRLQTFHWLSDSRDWIFFFLTRWILLRCENILEDEQAIKVLSQSKVISNQIAEQQKIAEETEKKIDAARNSYKPVSQKASVLFFCISDLSKIDSMYQYSLEFFVQLFEMAIRDSGKSIVLDTRLKLLMEYFTYSLYSNICRSLFVKDKLLFSYLLTVRLMLSHEEIKSDSFSFFCTGNTLMEVNSCLWVNEFVPSRL